MSWCKLLNVIRFAISNESFNLKRSMKTIMIDCYSYRRVCNLRSRLRCQIFGLERATEMVFSLLNSTVDWNIEDDVDDEIGQG